MRDDVIAVGIPLISWILLVLCALMVGISKTALPGLGTVPVTIAALAMPARASTTVILIALLVGDIWAVCAYRCNVEWKALLKLVPPVAIGLGAGFAFLGAVSDAVMARSIGVILLVLTLFTVLVIRRHTAEELQRRFGRPSARWLYGALGGFTTMTANAGGPAINLYFLASGFDVKRFIATQAWFFFIVNLIKVPFQIRVGLMSAHTLTLALTLIPFVLAGCWIGMNIAARISQKSFEVVIIVLTLITAAMLVVA